MNYKNNSVFISNGLKIVNGKILTSEGIEDKKTLLIKEGKILDICSERKTNLCEFKTIDAQGGYIIPGLVDIHCDALEFKFHPRPNAEIPSDYALYCYEKELLSCGITVQFHGIYWGEVLEKYRSVKLAQEMIKNILDYRDKSVLNHKIFVRFDISKCEAKDELMQLIKEKTVNLISFQYHLPGQAQFKDIKAFKDYYMKVRGWKEQELEEFITNSSGFDIRNRLAVLDKISQTANRFKISLVSHDDDTEEKVQLMKELGVDISEFPVNFQAARYAKRKNMYVVVGGPNVVQGKSSCGNVNALKLIKEKAADIICSDYHPPSMLCAAIKLYQEGILSLSKAINMITLNPAKATGLKDRGAILPGKVADIVIFKLKNGFPEVNRVFVKGKCVYHYKG